MMAPRLLLQRRPLESDRLGFGLGFRLRILICSTIQNTAGHASALLAWVMVLDVNHFLSVCGYSRQSAGRTR
jgi:hypothetical protein